MTNPHPLTDRFWKMRGERIRHRLSFLAGVMFGIAIACFWMALSHGVSRPVVFPDFTGILYLPEGIDI